MVNCICWCNRNLLTNTVLGNQTILLKPKKGKCLETLTCLDVLNKERAGWLDSFSECDQQYVML